MSDYTPTTDFSIKDGLITGDPNKIIKGSDFDIEFEAIETSIISKVDSSSLSASSGSSLVGHIGTGTGAVATTVQAKLRETISVKDFGAVGDGVTDDTEAIQAWIDAIDAQIVDATGLDGALTVYDLNGGKYAVSDTLNLSSMNSLFRNGTINAIGTNWASSDFVLNVTRPYSRLENLRINCNLSCSGIYVDAGRVKIDKCEVFAYVDHGILVPDTAGPEVWIHQCIIGELDSTYNPVLFADDANYVGTGIEIRKSDCKVSETIVRWTRCCYRATIGIQDIYNCHFYNGGLGIVQRANNQLIDWTAPSTGELTINGFYHDNGYSEFYNDRVNISDIRFICDSTDMLPRALLTFYSYAVGANARCNIKGIDIVDWDNSATLIDFVAYGDNTWSPTFASIETFIDDLIDAEPQSINLSFGSKNVSLSSEAYQGRDFWMRSGGTSTVLGFMDANTSDVANVPYIGSQGDDLLMEADDVFIGAKFLSVSNSTVGVTITPRAAYGYNSEFELKQRNSDNTAWVEKGIFFYEHATGLVKLRFGASGSPLITSGAGSPEGVVTAAVGSLFLRSDGGAGTTLYVKESGAGTTSGWIAK